MKHNFKIKKTQNGYTLIELTLVVVILGLLASIVSPKLDQILQRAYQSKAKGNLGNLRGALAMYYSDHEGQWPLTGYPQGDTHYTSDNLSLSGILVPQYTTLVPTPKLLDRVGNYNGLSVSFDDAAVGHMTMNPPKDVFIVWGPADYTPLLDSPYAYDNNTGLIYYPNGNYDLSNEYFYNW